MNNISQPAFKPNPASTVALNAATTTANVQVQAGQASRHVRVRNAGAVDAFIAFGIDNTVAATLPVNGGAAGSMAISAGAVGIFSAPYEFVPAGTAPGHAPLHFPPGAGPEGA